MKLEVANKNYAAVVIEVKNLVPLAGLDNLVALPVMGAQALVSKDTKIGDVGLLIPTEAQLSEEFVSANNLYRHTTYNSDTTKSGYLEDNRRVRAIRLRGHRSDALYMSLSSLDYISPGIGDALVPGDEFTSLDGHEVCRKYVVPVKNGQREKPARQKQIEDRVDPKLFHEHIDTENFFRNVDHLDPEAFVYVSQKLHGSSVRVAHLPVVRKLSLLERLATKLGVKVQRHSYANVYGSRRVTKGTSIDDSLPGKQNYYESDIWTVEGKKIDGILPKNMALYGELIGFTPGGAPIQSKYTYDLEPNNCRLYVYRLAMINEDGFEVDLSWDQVKAFCEQNGLHMVPEMWRGQLKDFKVDQYLNVKYAGQSFRSGLPAAINGVQWDGSKCVPLCAESVCDEGVVIRFDGLRVQAFKAKSPDFLLAESKQLDTGEADMESLDEAA